MIPTTASAYRFADITVFSELALPGLPAAAHGELPDVTVMIRPSRDLEDCTEYGRCDWSAEGSLVMDLPPFARLVFSVADSAIIVEPFPNARESVLRHVVVDTALPRWLAMVGRPTFHATAVESDWKVLAFLGGSGQGKSTLSGAMVANGARWIADDLLLLNMDGPIVQAIPTIVSTRLRPDSAGALGIDHREGEIISSRASKRRWDVPAAATSSPLACMFFLDRRAEPDGPVTISGITNSTAVGELAGHWLLTDTGAIAPLKFLTTATQLIRTTPMVRLSYPSSYEALPQVIGAVRTEVESGLRRQHDSSVPLRLARGGG